MKDLRTIVREAAALLPMEHVERQQVQAKDGLRNIVTEYDKKIQAQLTAQLQAAWPGAVFLGEEDLEQGGAADAPCFVIDPIDGTTNFVNDAHFSCISVARLEKGETVEAAIYNPYLNEMFYARKGAGAWLNDRRLLIEDKPLGESIVGYTNCPYDPGLRDGTFAFGRYLFDRVLDFRRMGSSALEICYAACGRYQLYCELILYPWDYLAAGLIVTEAGGIITDLEGGALRSDCRCAVAAGCPTAHRELLQVYADFVRETGFVPNADRALFKK